MDSIVMASEAVDSEALASASASDEALLRGSEVTPSALAQGEVEERRGAQEQGGVLIRRAALTDLESLVFLGQVCFPNDCWTNEGIQEELSRSSGIFRVAVTQAGVVGYLVAWQVLDELQILQIATDPRVQRQGIASQLLNEVLAEVRQGGGLVALLEVRSSNSAARAFYEHHGFRTLGIRRGYYAHPIEDAVLMVRDC